MGQAAAKRAGQVKDYFTSPGQPAQKPEDIEGFVAEDYASLVDKETE